MEEKKSDNQQQTPQNGISLWGWPLGILLAVFGLDQWTKWLISSRYSIGWHCSVIDGFFQLVHYRNTGAAWSILHDYTWLLSLVSILAFIIMIVLFRRWNGGSRIMAGTVALLIGGVAGNMVDRTFRGSVIDFLDFYVGNSHWPAFNVADSAIVVSIILLVILNFLRDRREKKMANLPK